MSESFQRELQKFDKERVLSAWDTLQRKQQGALEALNVPSVFVTDVASDLEVSRTVCRLIVPFLDLFLFSARNE